MKKIISYMFLAILIGLLAFYFWPEKKLDTTHPIDKVLVIKHERKLEVYSNGQKLKTYRIALGREPVGAKEYEGDKKTPQGLYILSDKNPNSSYHLNLGISYPNESDKQHARELGKPPGGRIKIHGLKNGLGIIGKFHRFFDWTLGCIAVTNNEIEELYKNVPVGTEIEIKE